MDLQTRASRHLAMGDSRRLAIVDELSSGDRAVTELAQLVGLPSNLVAHHLEVLESAGLIERHVSEGDRRRKYVTLRWDRVPLAPTPLVSPATVAFVCTHNSARSQFAAALWHAVTGAEVASAGTEPSAVIHPKALRVASEHGVDLTGRTPSGYDTIPWRPDLVISVCDRALEEGVPEAEKQLHWSVPDPVRVGTLDSFRSAFGDIAQRIGRLTGSRR
ncbi:MAG TPA: helix-turn-helix domain-containing protein [Acidimicrobiia bacterium]|nr:helix-turn-helix domain-containing protein [Acidimicrobiia bacterium]